MAVKLVGLDRLLKDIDKLKVEFIKDLSEETEGVAQEIALNAKQLAPHDLGDLKQNILATQQDALSWKVMANAFGNAPYSAYMEFGTGGLVEVPKELKDVAIKFKGKGLRQINLMPRPYLYPAFVKGRVNYIKKLKSLIKKFKK